MDAIKFWKENWLPWCKCPEEMSRVAEKIGHDNFVYWDVVIVEWNVVAGRTPFYPGNVYALPADFKCPHDPTPIFTDRPGDVCRWCGGESKPRMGWKEYEIARGKATRTIYGFSVSPSTHFTLDYACWTEGFGGIQYQRHDGTIEGFRMTAPQDYDDKPPFVPVKIRFWEAL